MTSCTGLEKKGIRQKIGNVQALQGQSALILAAVYFRIAILTREKDAQPSITTYYFLVR